MSVQSTSDSANTGRLITRHIFPRRQPKDVDENWCFNRTSTTKVSCLFTINNFSDRCNLISSQQFRSRTNLKWSILLHPKSDGWVLFSPQFDSQRLCNYQVSVLNGDGKEAFKITSKFRSILDYDPVRLFERAILFDKAKNLLPDDQLTIYCLIEIYNKSEWTSGKLKRFNLSVPACRLADDFGHLLDSHDSSDVTLIVNGREFKAHKIILATRSPVFKAMFSVDMKENNTNRVEVADMEPGILEEMLRFIYTGRSSLELESLDETIVFHEQNEEDTTRNQEIFVTQLFIASDKYQLARLRCICYNSLSEMITVDSVCRILSFADLYSLTELKAMAVDFIMSRADKVMKTEGWKQLIEENPKSTIEILTGHLASLRMTSLEPAKKEAP